MPDAQRAHPGQAVCELCPCLDLNHRPYAFNLAGDPPLPAVTTLLGCDACEPPRHWLPGYGHLPLVVSRRPGRPLRIALTDFEVGPDGIRPLPARP